MAVRTNCETCVMYGITKDTQVYYLRTMPSKNTTSHGVKCGDQLLYVTICDTRYICLAYDMGVYINTKSLNPQTVCIPPLQFVCKIVNEL
jgi:hypothetical protein